MSKNHDLQAASCHTNVAKGRKVLFSSACQLTVIRILPSNGLGFITFFSCCSCSPKMSTKRSRVLTAPLATTGRSDGWSVPTCGRRSRHCVPIRAFVMRISVVPCRNRSSCVYSQPWPSSCFWYALVRYHVVLTMQHKALHPQRAQC